MSARPNVLMVLSSYSELENGMKTGWYLPEMAHPYYELEPYADITVASPKGGHAPLDPASVELFKDELSVKLLTEGQELWKNTRVLADFVGKADEFDAIFYVGGHGPMFDLVTDKASIALIREFHEKGKIVSAVCHGPVVFLNVTLSNGEHFLQDQPVTGFSNAEEDAVKLSSLMPFELETELIRKTGGKFVKAEEPFAPKVVTARGGRLITGQNPASATPIAKELAKYLGVSAA